MPKKMIWKYSIRENANPVKIRVPKDSELLDVGFDPTGEPVAWYIFDMKNLPKFKEDLPKIVNVYVELTGVKFDLHDSAKHVKTLIKGDMVYHIFEEEVS